MKTSVLPPHTITRREQPCFSLNAADVGNQLVGQVLLVLALLDVGAAQALHVALVEHRRHGLDGLELGAHLFEQRAVEHARRAGRRVAVFLEDVPAAEHQVVEPRQGHEILDFGRLALGALAKANRAHLGERTDGLGEALADGDDAGDGGGADGTEADQEDAEFTLSRSDTRRLLHRGNISREAVRPGRPREPSAGGFPAKC